jgi:rhodanese-related sulfurtransferase
VSDQNATLPLEHFIQAVQSQLDKAQAAMAMKARNLNLPLTFAIKDITLDLRAHVEFARNEIRIRPAGAADTQASMFHLVFTAITRPMIEENATALADNPEDRQIDDLKDDSLTEENRRQLEWIGVRTVDKLQEMDSKGGVGAIGRVTGLPVDRLRQALARASVPALEHVTPVAPEAGDSHQFLRVRGHNLLGPAGGAIPKVTLGNRPVAVIKASARELLLAPQAHQWAGELNVSHGPGVAASMAFDLSPFAPPPPPAPPQETGGAE